MKASGASAVIVAAVATFRRDDCLQRLLHHLSAQTTRPVLTIVVDNASLTSTERVCRDAKVPVKYLPSPRNLGCGDGLFQAEAWLRADGPESWTHLWILDDDVVPPASAAGRLCEALSIWHAGMAAPLLTDEQGRIWGFPEPLEADQRRAIRDCTLPEDALRRLGRGPFACTWTTGACQMVSRAALEECGMHRRDFWLLGEDLEFSMRIASRCGACFITDLAVPHLPPPAPDAEKARASGYKKFLSLLQNLSYISFRCPHRFHMRSYLAGNFNRFFRTEGVSVRTVKDALSCFWNGALAAKPFGAKIPAGK